MPCGNSAMQCTCSGMTSKARSVMPRSGAADARLDQLPIFLFAHLVAIRAPLDVPRAARNAVILPSKGSGLHTITFLWRANKATTNELSRAMLGALPPGSALYALWRCSEKAERRFIHRVNAVDFSPPD